MVDKISIMNKARKKYCQQREAMIREKAKKSFQRYKNNPLFIAGIMLYWAEGMMSNAARGSRYGLILSNSKHELLKVYCNFIRRFLDLPNERLRASLFLYPDLNENKIKEFWSRKLSIPFSQFNKTIILDNHAHLTKNKLSYGTCRVSASSREARITIEAWVDYFCRQNLR